MPSGDETDDDSVDGEDDAQTRKKPSKEAFNASSDEESEPEIPMKRSNGKAKHVEEDAAIESDED